MGCYTPKLSLARDASLLEPASNTFNCRLTAWSDCLISSFQFIFLFFLFIVTTASWDCTCSRLPNFSTCSRHTLKLDCVWIWTINSLAASDGFSGQCMQGSNIKWHIGSTLGNMQQLHVSNWCPIYIRYAAEFGGWFIEIWCIDLSCIIIKLDQFDDVAPKYSFFDQDIGEIPVKYWVKEHNCSKKAMLGGGSLIDSNSDRKFSEFQLVSSSARVSEDFSDTGIMTSHFKICQGGIQHFPIVQCLVPVLKHFITRVWIKSLFRYLVFKRNTVEFN